MREVGSDKCAHAGAGGEKQRQRCKAREVLLCTAQLQVAVEHGIGRRPFAIAPQVHEQEGEVVEHVDGGDLLAELDGVEELRRPILHDDVAAMHVAVAAAHQPALAALRQQMAAGTESRLIEGVELERVGGAEDVRRIDEGLGELRTEVRHDVRTLHLAARCARV